MYVISDQTGVLGSRSKIIPGFPKEGVSFIDLLEPLRDSEVIFDLVEAMFTSVSLRVRSLGSRPDIIACLDARGFIFGSLLAQRMGLPLGAIRKSGKLPPPTISESYSLEYGESVLEVNPEVFKNKRVLLVDDVLATGGTALAAIKLLEQSNAVVWHSLFIADLPFLGGRDMLAQEKAYIGQSAMITYGV